MLMSGVSVTYGIMAPWLSRQKPAPPAAAAAPWRHHDRPTDFGPDRRGLALGHPGGRRQGQGPQGRRRERHRLRRRRARFPHSRAHRGRRRGGLSRSSDPQVHADQRAPRAAGGGGRQDPPRLGARGLRRPGADHQRRQAGHCQLLRRPVRPGRRGAGARPLLDHLSRGHQAGRGGARGHRHRRRQWLPGHHRPAGGGPDPPHQGAAVRVPLQPHRGGLPAPGDPGTSGSGPRRTACGS